MPCFYPHSRVGLVFVGPVLDGLRLRGSALQSVGRPPLNPGPAHLTQSPVPRGRAITGLVVARRSPRGLGPSAYRRGSLELTPPVTALLLAVARCCAAGRRSLRSPRGGAAAPRACGPPPPRRVSWHSFRRGLRAFRRVCGGRNLLRKPESRYWALPTNSRLSIWSPRFEMRFWGSRTVVTAGWSSIYKRRCNVRRRARLSRNPGVERL